MDWPRPQPESSYLWDQVSQLRCYLYDPTSSHISTSLSRYPAFRSLLSRFSFSPFLSLSLTSPLSPRHSPCHSLALFLRSYSLPALYFASPFHFHPVPRYLSSAAVRVISSRSLFSLLIGRSLCFSLKVTRPPARCTLERQIVYIREIPPSRICAIACFRSHAG